MLVNFVTCVQNLATSTAPIGQHDTYEGASAPPHDNEELAQVRRAVRQRVARIVHDSRVRVRRKDREGGRDRERERAEVRDRRVCDSRHGRVLQRDDRVVERRDRDGVDGVAGARGVERALRAVVAGGDGHDLARRGDAAGDDGAGALRPAVGAAEGHGEDVLAFLHTA